MSRIGRKPIAIPAGVDVSKVDGVVTVKGPKGTLTQKVHPNMTALPLRTVRTGPPSQRRERKPCPARLTTLIANMVTGVTQGHKKLEVNGVGYRARSRARTW